MCQTCPAISDDISTFIHEECPCSFDEGKIVSPAYATPPAARTAEGASPDSSGSRHSALSIRKRAGRIGGEYMEVPHVPPKPAINKPDPRVTEPTKRSMPAGLPEPEHPKLLPKKTWTDLPTNAAGSMQLVKPPSADDSKAGASTNLMPNAPPPPPAASTPERKSANPPIVRTELASALHAAQMELKQLLLLQALDQERKQLESLLLQKAKDQACESKGN